LSKVKEILVFIAIDLRMVKEEEETFTGEDLRKLLLHSYYWKPLRQQQQ
jgi:hypothetical protein